MRNKAWGKEVEFAERLLQFSLVKTEPSTEERQTWAAVVSAAPHSTHTCAERERDVHRCHWQHERLSELISRRTDRNWQVVPWEKIKRTAWGQKDNSLVSYMMIFNIICDYKDLGAKQGERMNIKYKTRDVQAEMSPSLWWHNNLKHKHLQPFKTALEVTERWNTAHQLLHSSCSICPDG